MISSTEISTFFQAHEYLAHLVLFLGSYFETLIGPGFFIHGEMFFIPGGLAAGAGYLNVWLVYLACVLGGILGDHSSYFIGKHYGKKAITYFFKKENKYLNLENFNKGKSFFRKYGDKSICLSRLMGPVSWITPFLAGSFKHNYSKFMRYNLLGVMAGIGQFVFASYIIGASFMEIIGVFKKYYWGITIIIAISILVIPKIASKHYVTKIRTKILEQLSVYGVYYTIIYSICFVAFFYLVSLLVKAL